MRRSKLQSRERRTKKKKFKVTWKGRNIMEFEKLQEIIANAMNVPKENITPETTFVDDLGADSLDVLEITMGIEEEFDIQIENEDLEKISTVQDVIDQIKKAIE